MKVTVHPCTRLYGTLSAPGSKNYTSRYLLAAALAAGVSELYGPATMDDAAAMIDCCRALGVQVSGESNFTVRGVAGVLQSPPGGVLNVRNAGMVARLVSAVSALLPDVRIETSHPDSLGRRPQGGLIAALERLGARVESQDGRLPLRIRGGRLHGGSVTVDGRTTSQFVSALLFLTPLLKEDSVLTVDGPLRSAPAVRQTLAVLGEARVDVGASADLQRFEVPGGQQYRPGRFNVPGDWPSAAAVLAAVAVAGGEVVIDRLHDDAQGERTALEAFEQMGAEVDYDAGKRRVRLARKGPLRPVSFDGDRATDAVLALAATAAFAQGTSRFYNVGNLRWKESDRIYDFCRELQRAGVRAEGGPEEIVIHGGGSPAGGVEIDAHHDHRLIQALCIVGLGAERPVVLADAQHIDKSYPSFFSDLIRLGARLDGA